MEAKVKYYKDYGHNYLILGYEQTEKEAGYRYRMLSLNRVDGLLSYSIRNVNGSTCLYYDISSKVSIENLYQNKKLSYEQVGDLFVQLDQICRSLSHYFLEEKELLLGPKYIYYDLAAKKYFGVYYPKPDIEEENIYEELLDFLLAHIDTEDQKLTSKLYRFYETAEDSLFSLADGAASFLEENEKILEERNGISITGINDISPVDGKNMWKADSAGEESEVREINTFEPEEEIRFPKAEKNSGQPMPLFYVILAVLSLAGSIGAYWLYMTYELTGRELMVLFGCGIAMAVGCPFCIFLALRAVKSKKKKAAADRRLLTEIEDEFRDSRPVSLENVLHNDNHPFIGEHENVSMINRRNEAMQTTYGETVFIDLNKQTPEYKLYALDSKNKKHIDLTQFPYTIGKMAGCVDCVLMDASISRLHARIERKEGKLFLTDMNSTNGTYKNGLRMEPSETTEIEPGDEIRFGKLNYCYR